MTDNTHFVFNKQYNFDRIRENHLVLILWLYSLFAMANISCNLFGMKLIWLDCVLAVTDWCCDLVIGIAFRVNLYLCWVTVVYNPFDIKLMIDSFIISVLVNSIKPCGQFDININALITFMMHSEICGLLMFVVFTHNKLMNIKNTLNKMINLFRDVIYEENIVMVIFGKCSLCKISAVCTIVIIMINAIFGALYTPTIVYIIFRVYIRLKGCISIQLNQYGVERFNNINFILIIIGYGIIYPMNKIIISIDVLVIFVMFVHNKLRVIRIISNAWLKLCNELIVFIHELIEIMHKQKLAVIFDEYFLLFRVITMFTMMICIAASCALYIPTMKSFTLLVCTIFEMNIRLMRRIPINLNHNGFDRLNNIILVFIVLGHVVLLLLYSVNEIYIYDTYNDCVFLRPTSDVILDIGIYNNLTNAYTI